VVAFTTGGARHWPPRRAQQFHLNRGFAPSLWQLSTTESLTSCNVASAQPMVLQLIGPLSNNQKADTDKPCVIPSTPNVLSRNRRILCFHD
jgi:hypothetical protein